MAVELEHVYPLPHFVDHRAVEGDDEDRSRIDVEWPCCRSGREFLFERLLERVRMRSVVFIPARAGAAATRCLAAYHHAARDQAKVFQLWVFGA
ncbi:MAG TPA: hypothetical protein VGG41_05900 [Solirubrobacteraceae bacterium]